MKMISDGNLIPCRRVLGKRKGTSNLQSFSPLFISDPQLTAYRYGRVIERIESNPVPKDKAAARKILEWIGSATRPLRYEEVIQALVIESGSSGFTKGRKAFRDIVETCGPIIEVVGDYVGFVHFTAKE